MATAPRLTEEEVHKACAEIAAKGERPTALKLLEQLGRGSLTTISKYLDSWKATEDAKAMNADNLPAAVALPDELVQIGNEALKKLWQVAKRLADADFENQREALNQAGTELQAKLDDACKFSEAQALKIEQLQEEIIELKARIEERQQQQQKQEVLIAKKDKELKSLDMQVHKLQSSLDLAVKSTDEAKHDLKSASKALSEAEKRVAKLEGQLEVYLSLDKPVRPKKRGEDGNE